MPPDHPGTSGNPFDHYAFVSLGANLASDFGGPAETVWHALARLSELGQDKLLVSSLWQTDPVDCPPGSPPFVNAAAGLIPEEGESAHSFLYKLQQLENEFGRRRSGQSNEARVLDLDLITFRNEQHKTRELTLPHPRAAQRKFVLEPLREITGGYWSLPGMNRNLEACLDEIKWGRRE